MALLVVAYPQLTPSDYAWIQAIRQQHDAHYELIAPHFTLVFPVSTIAQDAFVAHIAAQYSKVRWSCRGTIGIATA
jgi:hypothetical protein